MESVSRIEDSTDQLPQTELQMEKKNRSDVFDTCTCCGKNIRLGNAFVGIGRVAEQMDFVEGKGLVSEVLDRDYLAILCSSCGNKKFMPSRLRKKLAKPLGVELPESHVVRPYEDIYTTPDPCDLCGCEIYPGNTIVNLETLIGQADWSNKLDDSIITPIYAESLFHFCANCGNQLSTEHLEKNVVNALNQIAPLQLSDNLDSSDEDDEDYDDYDDYEWDDDEPARPPVLGYFSKEIMPNLAASFGDVKGAMKYVVDNLIPKSHSYIVNLRGGWEIERGNESVFQVVPENKIFDNKRLGLTINLSFSKYENSTLDLLRFMELPFHKHFVKFNLDDIPCFAFRCGTDIDLLERVVRLLLVEVYRYTSIANIECNVIDDGLREGCVMNSPDINEQVQCGPKSYLTVSVGDRIIHEIHGPCQVTYVGDDYIGIYSEETGHAVFKKGSIRYMEWSESSEISWRAAQAAMEQEINARITLPWPKSTFKHELGDNMHFMGSHWRPFYENGIDDVMPLLKEMIEKGALTTGYGDTQIAPHSLPDSWQAGRHLVWPRPEFGAIISVATSQDENRFCTVYPWWSAGSSHKLILEDVLIWESGVEGQITAKYGNADFMFFDTLYLHNRQLYQFGNEYEFSLTGIAYSAELADVQDIPFTPNPEQIEWEKVVAHMRGEEEPTEKPTTIRMKGAALLFNVTDWDKDDYSFRGPIKEVRPFSNFLGQDGWVVKTTVRRQSDCEPEDFDLDIIVTTLVWKGESPPEVGQDIEGALWLQGYLQGEITGQT